ncbi:MAG: hypothetical protein WD081_03380 [Gammaproteobacteria bacterium]
MSRDTFRRGFLHPIMWLATAAFVTSASASGAGPFTPYNPELPSRFGVVQLEVLDHSDDHLVVQALGDDGGVVGTFDLRLSATESAFRVHTDRTDWALEISTTEPFDSLAGEVYSGNLLITHTRDGVVTSEVLATGTMVGDQPTDVQITDLQVASVDESTKPRNGKGKSKKGSEPEQCDTERFGGLDAYDAALYTAVITDESLAAYRPRFFAPAAADSVSASFGSTLDGDGVVIQGCTQNDHNQCAAICAIAVVCGIAGCGGGVGCFTCIAAAYQCGYCLGKIAQGCTEMY